MAKFTKVEIANRRKSELKNIEVVWPSQVRALDFQIQISAELILLLLFTTLAPLHSCKEPLNLKGSF